MLNNAVCSTITLARSRKAFLIVNPDQIGIDKIKILFYG